MSPPSTSSPPLSGPKRRFFAPEVIQTSAMDCGPAALKCLLEGFGVPVSYGRLREACQTSVDGTSIDTLEALARQVGLESEQVMIPLDHLLLKGSEALPAIVVVRLPSGLTHFVVAWRAHGPWVQVMDPARGRRWVRREAFLRDVYVHTMTVPAEAFRDWAGSEQFTAPLRERLAPLGLPDGGAALVEVALADPSWRGLAALDAAVRTLAGLVDRGAVAAGDEAGRLLAELIAAEMSSSSATAGGVLPVRLATASPAPPDADGTPQVAMRGAVLVHVAGAAPLDETLRAQLPRELRAAIEEPPAHPGEALFELLKKDGALRWGALVAGLAVAALGAVFEAAIFRGLFDVAAGHGAGLIGHIAGTFAPAGRAAAASVVGLALFAAAALLALEWPVAAALRGAGRRLEERMRRAFLRKIPRLGDRYFHSRPVSDMAERAHLTHRLRALPGLGGQLVRAALELTVTAGALAWLDPADAALALALAAAMLLVPLVAQPALAERDMRMRNHAGALASFYLDALRGLAAIRTHRAEDAIARDHVHHLREWLAGARAALRAALAAETVQAVVGWGLAAWLLVRFVGRGAAAPAATGDPGTVLLVAYWALALPGLGQEIATLVQQVPGQRNVTLRLVEPLGAPEDEDGRPDPAARASHAAPAEEGRRDTSAVRIEFGEVVVRAGGHTILTVDALAIAPGEHVAIVGLSGAGKSSLVGLLLGWHRAAEGAVRVDGAVLAGATLDRLRAETVWIDPTVYLWNRSLHQNLAYGLAAAPATLEEAMAEAISEAELGEVVARLPDGARSRLGEAGALLSGGEGQRVRFGRGIARPRPRLVIMDEPFRGLARDQRHDLLARACARWRDTTLLCVTHDIEETRTFSRVLVVADGRVVEDAPPAQLVAQPTSRYATLVEAEARLRRAAWTRGGTVAWRRLTMQGGRVLADEEARR
ncbi:MAG TPA: cysteine peptidase family C39 domain-containing protein [Polyangia bacterium]|nr:cysteine peptidase family C39 domain-containing protein [Polyangia bacterium]